jgi:hypothetical protein
MQREMEQAQQMDMLSQSAGPQGGGVGDPGAGATGMPQQGGTMPAAPGAPPQNPVDQFLMQRQNSPNVPRTPEDLQSQAQLLAQQLLSLPESVKDSQLIKLKKSDATMHALVKSIIDDIRQQARTEGGAQVMAQQFGQPAGGQGPVPPGP